MSNSVETHLPRNVVLSRVKFIALTVFVVAMVAWFLRPSRPLLSEWIGQNVRVQFRRDALGAASNIPISPDTGEINGASTSIIGTLVSVTESEIVIMRSRLSQQARPHWIPRETILYVKVNP